MRNEIGEAPTLLEGGNKVYLFGGSANSNITLIELYMEPDVTSVKSRSIF